MNFQYYETLLDKSKVRMLNLIDYISPPFKKSDLKELVNEIKVIDSKGKISSQKDFSINALKDFNRLNGGRESKADYSILTEEQIQQIYKIFISSEITNQLTVKWRFYQHFKGIRQINIESIGNNQNSKSLIDFIIKTIDKQQIFVVCLEVLDHNTYQKVVKGIIDFAETNNVIPNRLIIAVHKSYRNIPVKDSIEIKNDSVIPEIWIEWIEDNCPFNSEDLLIINNKDLIVAGFNFTGMANLLEYVHNNSEGGQTSIFRQPGFFSEKLMSKPKIELIWKGIMMKTDQIPKN